MSLVQVIESSRRRTAVRRAGFALILAMLTVSAAAETASPFSLQGFGTLGLARTTSDEVEYVRDLSQPSGIRRDWDGRLDSVLGLQATWQISPQLSAVVQGMANKEIADHLCISVNTVITHRRNIARKLQIHSPAGLTIYAIVNNLVDITSVKL